MATGSVLSDWQFFKTDARLAGQIESEMKALLSRVAREKVDSVMLKGRQRIRVPGWVLAFAFMAAASAQANEAARLLGQQITEGLAAGRDVSALLVQARQMAPAKPLPEIRSTTARDASASENRLLLALEQAVGDSISASQLASVLYAYENWQAYNLLMQGRFSQIEADLVKLSVQGDFRERLDKNRKEFEKARQEISAPLDECAALVKQQGGSEAVAKDSRSSTVCKKSIKSARKLLTQRQVKTEARILRGGLLPFHRARTAPRALPTGAEITPAYLSSQEVAVLPDDHIGDAAQPLTAAIAAKAKSLDYDYVRLYEFVRNNFRTEWYAGAQKSPDVTLSQLAGNDVDQAALLMGLYRASGVPVRYVHGVIEQPIDMIQESLGVTTPAQATTALTQAGIAFSPVTRGGKLAALKIEHSWVEARVPYANYRGTTVDTSGATWVALMPAIKRHAVVAPDDLWKLGGLNAQNLITDYLASPQDLTLMEKLRQRLNNYLLLSSQGGNYSTHLGSITPVAENLDLLPNSLPVKVLATYAEEANLAASRQAQLRITLRNASNDGLALDYSAALSAIAGQRVTLSYIPATVDDSRITNLYGGLSRVPLYMIRVRAQLKVNGVVVAYGKDVLEPGVYQTLEIISSGPAGEERADHQVLAGGIEAISIQTQQTVPVTENTNPDDSESQAGKLLYRVASEYTMQWMQAEQELAALRQVAIVRPSPSVVIVGNSYQFERVQGRLQQLRWTGVAMDAALHSVGIVPRGNDDNTVEWMKLSGLQGSALEQSVFAQLFLVNSISADKGLMLAQSQGIERKVLSGNGNDSVINTLAHPDAVKADIRKWLALGFTVTVPQQQVSYEAWTGSVWRVEDPATGSAGYFIAGGLAGGESAVTPADWTLQWLREALEKAGMIRNNANSTSVASLTKVGASDGMLVKVGEAYDTPLAVRAQDEFGVPVVGASITFLATAGNGTFSNGSNTYIAISDADGFAQAEFKAGTSTDPGIFYHVNPNDKYPQRIGINEVTVLADGHNLGMRPFINYGSPGEATQLIRTNGERMYVEPKIWSDTVLLQAQDANNNPVANANVSASAGEIGAMCSGPAPATGNLKFASGTAVSDSEGCLANVEYSCAQASASETSKYEGFASFYVIGGGVPQASYKANFSVGGSGTYKATYQASGSCSGASPDYSFYTTYSIDKKGRLVNAARVTEKYENPLPVVFYSKGPASYAPEMKSDGDGHTSCEANPSQDIEVKPVRQVDGFRFYIYGASAATARQTAPNIIEALLTAGSVPEMVTVWMDAKVHYDARVIDGETCAEKIEKVDRTVTGYPSNRFYSVQATITGVEQPDNSIGDPAKLVVDANGLLEKPASLLYEVKPAQYPVATEAIFDNGAYVNGGDEDNGSRKIAIPRDTPFKVTQEEKVSLRIYDGIKSDPYTLPVTTRLFRNVRTSGHIYAEMDVVNEDMCATSTTLSFSLAEEADVSIDFVQQNFDPVSGLPTGDGGTVHFVENQHMAEGNQQFFMTTGTIPPGRYKVVIKGTRTRDGSVESDDRGNFTSEQTRIDTLAVGRTIVKGVDIADGSYSMSSLDMMLPGRMPLSLSRSYSSAASSYIGTMGIGWSHNFNSSISIDRCGRVMISGGAGGGMRFQPQSDGTLKPFKGYHGTLIAKTDSRSFDFYSKDGTQYHYTNYGWQGISPQWNLEYIQDTNGNSIRLAYDPKPRKSAKLVSAVDSVGRIFTFKYEEKPFKVFVVGVTAPDGTSSALYTDELKEVITSIEGPGLKMQYDYDNYGRLIEAKRPGNPSRVEKYTYAVNPLVEPIPLAHTMREYKNPRGFETRIKYKIIPASWQLHDGDSIVTVTPDVGVVESVKPPSLGDTSFSFDFSARRTTVNDAGAGMSYTWDKYGRVTEQHTPSGVISMEWSPDDIVMRSRTNQRGYKTTFDYDDDGNVTSETLDGHERKAHFKRLGQFGQIKDRADMRSDRNGKESSFDYYNNGNLRRMTDAEGNSTTYGYFDNGDLRTVTNARGATTTYDYDDAGNIASVKDPDGGVTTTTYGARYLKKIVKDPDGVTATYGYSGLDFVSSISYSGGGTKSFDPDEMGNPRSETDESGNRTFYTYDGQNKVTSISRPDGGYKTIGYDSRGNKDSESDWDDKKTTYDVGDDDCVHGKDEPMGRHTTYVPDALCNIKSETDHNGNKTEYDYDGYNRVTEKREEKGRTTKYTYDGENKKTETDPEGLHTTFAYDDMNRLETKTETGEQVRKTSYGIDKAGNTESETDALSRKSTYSYYLSDRRKTYTDRMGAQHIYTYWPSGRIKYEDVQAETGLNRTQYFYNSRGRLEQKIDAAGQKWSYSYYNNGDLKTETWPNNNVVTHTYDEVGRRRTSNDLEGLIGEWDYDHNGKITHQRDGKRNETILKYNDLGQLTKRTEPMGRVIDYVPNIMGHVESETNDRGSHTTYGYDKLYRLTSQTDDAGSQSFDYDLVGRRTYEKDRRNKEFWTVYNKFGYVTSRRDLVATRTFVPDLLGNKKSEEDWNKIVTTYGYDRENRLTDIFREGVTLWHYDYDKLGRRYRETDANQNATNLVFDGIGRVTKESRPEASVTTHVYNSNGEKEYTQLPEGQRLNFTYDKRLRVKTESNGVNAEVTTYGYDANNNRTSKKRPLGANWTYNFDALNRLWRVQSPLGNTDYGYDTASNLESEKDAAGRIVSYTNNLANRRDSMTVQGAGTEHYGYDGNGNRTSLLDAKGQNFIYVYDDLNRLTSRSGPGTETIYELDKNGNPRVITERDAQGTRLTKRSYDRFDRLESETDVHGQTVTYTYYPNGMRKTRKDPDGATISYGIDGLNRITSMLQGSATTYYGYDRNSRLRDIVYPSSSMSQYYDDAGRITDIYHNANGGQFAIWHYEFDLNGNRKLEQLSTPTGEQRTTYDYDHADRLTDVAYPE